MVKIATENLKNILKQHGLKVTKHRLLILEIFTKATEPMSVYLTTEKIRKKSQIDQATVYRNIVSLNDCGLVRKLSLVDGCFQYELTSHLNFCRFVCVRCGTTEKIKDTSFFDTIKKTFKKNKKSKIGNIHLVEVTGFCKKCE